MSDFEFDDDDLIIHVLKIENRETIYNIIFSNTEIYNNTEISNTKISEIINKIDVYDNVANFGQNYKINIPIWRDSNGLLIDPFANVWLKVKLPMPNNS